MAWRENKIKRKFGSMILTVSLVALLLPSNLPAIIGSTPTNSLGCNASITGKSCSSPSIGPEIVLAYALSDAELLSGCGSCTYYNCPDSGCNCEGSGYLCEDRGCIGSNCDTTVCPNYCKKGPMPCNGTGDCIGPSEYSCGGTTCSAAHCSTNYCLNKGMPCDGSTTCSESGPKCGGKECSTSNCPTAYCKHDVGMPCGGAYGACPENCGYPSCNIDGCPYYCGNAKDCGKEVHQCYLWGCKGLGCGGVGSCGNLSLCAKASTCPKEFCAPLTDTSQKEK